MTGQNKGVVCMELLKSKKGAYLPKKKKISKKKKNWFLDNHVYTSWFKFQLASSNAVARAHTHIHSQSIKIPTISNANIDLKSNSLNIRSDSSCPEP